MKYELDSDDVFIQLDKYSLIKINNEKIYIHSLVQDVIRYSLTENKQLEWFSTIESLMSNIFYYDNHKQETWYWTNSLLIHVVNFIKLSDEYKIENINIAYLSNNLGLLYQAQGKYDEAESYYKKALAIIEKELGLNHPYTATSYWWLGIINEQKGLLNESKLLYLKAIKIYEKTLGKNHHSTISIKEYLSNLLEKIK